MRIGSNLSGIDLVAQHNLLNAFNQLGLSSVRLSTMQRINTGADDPAGLIAAENLRAELAAIQQAGDNAARARGMIRMADSALGEVSSLLGTVRGNVVAAAGGGLSDEELAALQIETDAALEAIDRIGNITSYGGRKLLDGSASDGGLTFVFSSDVDDTSTLELPHVSTSTLGGAAGRLSDLAGGGTASLTSGDSTKAIEILDAARSEVLGARAQIGAFEKYTIESSERVLGSMEVNLSAAFSQIFDTDVAAETSHAVRCQILVDAAASAVLLTGQARSLLGGLVGDYG